MKRILLLSLVALAPLLIAYDLIVSGDVTIRSQGLGGRVNYIPAALTNVSGCSSTWFYCAVFDDSQFSGTAFTYISAATYTSLSGGSLAGTGVCNIAFSGGTGGTGTVPISSGVISAGATITILTRGLYNTAPTAGVLSNGTGTTCTGSPLVSSTLGSVAGANAEIAIKPLTGGNVVCITCGNHQALFGAGYDASVTGGSIPSNLGTPVFDQTGLWLAMEVADPVLINTWGCPASKANPGAGFCMNIVVCAFNPAFTESTVDGVLVSGNALSNCTPETNFPHSLAGSHQAALHPRWGNNTTTQLFAWSQEDNAGSGAYCTQNPIQCNQGQWSIHIGVIVSGVYTETVSYSSITGCSQTISGTPYPCNGWFEPGNFGGTRFVNPVNNTDNGFFTFVSSAGTVGQQGYCPDMFAVHWADNTFSRLTTTGQNCINNPATSSAWNEHPTFSPDGTRMAYVSAADNYWVPAPPGNPQTPLEIWMALTNISGSTMSIYNNRRMTFYWGNYPSQSENTNSPQLTMSQMNWRVDGGAIMHITSCNVGGACTAPYGIAQLVLANYGTAH